MATASPAATAPLIVIVDDDASVCWAVERLLSSAGYRTLIAADAAAARRHLKRQPCDLVLSDVRMPGESGLDLLSWLREHHPQLPVIISTAHGAVDVAVEAVRRGACDYLAKPFDQERLLTTCARVLGDRPLAAAARPTTHAVDESLTGASPLMQDVYRLIAKASASEVDVLIHGETGTGKSLAVKALLHFAVPGTWHSIVCALTPQAISDWPQHQVSGIIIEGIDNLSDAAQAQLAALLDRRAGGPRCVCTVAGDPDALVAAGRLRADLRHRLGVISIAMPALRDHLEDLPDLVRALLARHAARLGHALSLTDAAHERLRNHLWPGNVRELERVLFEAAAIAGDGTLDRTHIRLHGAGAAPIGSIDQGLLAVVDRLCMEHPGDVHTRFLDVVESPMLRAALARTRGNQLRAAELLGINRITLKKRMDQLGLTRPETGDTEPTDTPA